MQHHNLQCYFFFHLIEVTDRDKLFPEPKYKAMEAWR